MIFSVGSSLSALSAFGTKMGVTSNNLANVESQEFKKSRTLMEEGSNGNVDVEIEQVDTPGYRVLEEVDGQLTEQELSNVDMAEEITETIPTQRGYEANLKALKTQMEMYESVIDTLA